MDSAKLTSMHLSIQRDGTATWFDLFSLLDLLVALLGKFVEMLDQDLCRSTALMAWNRWCSPSRRPWRQNQGTWEVLPGPVAVSDHF